MTDDVIMTRTPNARGRFTATHQMFVEPGTKADWDELHELHYKAEKLPVGPQFYRCVTADGELVGVVVISVVALLLAARHEVFPHLKPGRDTHFTNVHRPRWLNANMRRAARIVTDTLYRGVGISYRMTNLAMRMVGVRFVEIQSSMSKFNPFDQKAGFRHGHLRDSNAYREGLKWFRTYFDAHPGDFEALMAEYDSKPKAAREAIYKQMQVFYHRFSAKEKTGNAWAKGMTRWETMPVRQIVRELQQLVFATPAYGVWTNPDLGFAVPKRLPLSAFDWQAPDAPLNRAKLQEWMETCG